MKLKPQHELFVKEMVKHGDHIKAYMVAYKCTDRKRAASEGGKLRKKPEIIEAIRKKSKNIVEKAEAKAVDELKDKIVAEVLDATEKRNLLAQIARGEIEIPVNRLVWDKKSNQMSVMQVMEKPDHITRIKAIEVDNKMSGDNAPDKSQVQVQGNLTDEQFSQLLKDARANKIKTNTGE